MDPEKKHGLNEEEHIVDMEKLREEIPELREEENVLGRIARYFIKKNRVVIMMIILVLIWGVGSYTSLKRELNPEIVMPYGYIMTTYMGAGPEEMEKLVTDKLESKVSTISEIKKVTSGSSYGFSGIFVEFEQGVDIDKKINELKDAVDEAKADLPSEADTPIVKRIETNNAPIMLLTLSGKYRDIELTNYAKNLQEEIETVSGVSEVKLIGDMKREIKVIVDPQKLAQYQLSISMIKDAIQYSNVNIPGGDLEMNDKYYQISVKSEFKDAAEIGNIVVTHSNNVPLLLRDIAMIEDGYKDKTTYSRTGFQIHSDNPSIENCVALSIKKKTDADVIDVSAGIHGKLEELKGNAFPEDVQIEVVGDTSVYVKQELGNVTREARNGLFIVVIVLFLFIGLRESLIVSTVIPISVLACIGMMKAYGMTFNFITLFAIVLALGMIVDDAIVIMQNIDRLKMKGVPIKLAAVAGTNQISPAVASSTFTTLASFAPLLLTSGIIGQYIQSIPLVVIFLMSASLLSAILITPGMSAMFLDEHHEVQKQRKNKSKYRKIIPIAIVVLLSGFAFTDHNTGMPGILSLFSSLLFGSLMYMREFERGLFKKHEKESGNGLLEKYSVFLRDLITHKGKRRKLIALSIAALLLSLTFIPLGIVKVAMFTNDDQDRIYIDVTTPKGTIIEDTKNIVEQIEPQLFKYAEIKTFTSSIGTAMADSYDDFSGGDNANPTYARITIDLIDVSEREKTSMDIADELREDVKYIVGAKVEVLELSSGPPSNDPVTVRLRGESLDDLNTVAQDFKAILLKIDGTNNVKTSNDEKSPELQIQVDKQRAAMLGLNDMMISSTIRNYVEGEKSTKLRNNQDDIDIVIKLPENKLDTKQELENLYFQSTTGVQIPFSAFATVKDTKTLTSISHEDEKRQFTVTSGVEEGTVAADVVSEFQNKIESYNLPEGITVSYGGEMEDMNQSFKEMAMNMVIAIILIIAILTIQFNSVKQTLIILSTIPLSFIGVMPGLAITGNEFTFTAFLGVVALVGIVVKNAIVLVDYINFLRAEGMEIVDAVVTTGATRMVPVLATAITAIGGILPMTLQTAFFAPLGYSIIFGLSVSTVLTLVVVPTIYVAFNEGKEKRERKKVEKRMKKNDESELQEEY